MPSHKELERLLGTAVVDGEFRASLLESPAATALASGFGLSPEELEALRSADVGSLEELAAHLHAWITKAPKPRRAQTTHWTLDGHQSARMAV